MIWYLLNILIVTIAYLWPTKQTNGNISLEIGKSTKKRVCIVGSLGWILLSGLRHISVGADTGTYENAFEGIANESWNDVFSPVYDKYILGIDSIKDPGYDVFQKIAHIVTDSYQIYLILVAALFFIAMGIFIYKMSRDPYISYVLFSTLFYSFFAITGIRQTIATAITVLIGTFLIKSKKLVYFLIIVLLASTVHMSCLCIIPFYFISKIKINKATLLIYWGAIVGSFIFRYELLELLQSIVGYDSYQDYEGAGAGTFLYLLLAIGVIVTLTHKKLLEGNERIMQISINALMLACFFSPLLLINQSTMRLVQYFSLFLMIVLPEIAKLFPKKNDRTLYVMAIVAILIGLLVMNSPSYKFFWQ